MGYPIPTWQRARKAVYAKSATPIEKMIADNAVDSTSTAFRRRVSNALQQAFEHGQRENACNAVIQFILEKDPDDPIAFLRCWNEGDFETLREEWEQASGDPKIPDAVFIGAEVGFVPRGIK